MPHFSDIFIIGGGINGTAIAADAAGRGLSVTLCEKNDLASGTSSTSTKLIHGGLRYLEFYEFNLVRKALREREILLKRAPHLIAPLEFILPHEKHLRPAWLIRLGLFLYDHLATHPHLPNSRPVQLQNTDYGKALLPIFKKGFSYYDCFTDDARLVVLNALSARENNAAILTHTEFISAEREQNHWKIHIKNTSGENVFYFAKALVNATGPWINHVQKNKFNIKLVKGSHIVVPKLYDGDFAYILQNSDQRITFVIPYQGGFSLIGTTDILFSDDLNHVTISEEEENYLCNIINQYFKKSIRKKDIIWSYAGVRCLQEDETVNPSKTTRDYKLLIETKNNLPLLTVIGGKITTHRLLAENALLLLHPFFESMSKEKTENTPLPGGDIENNDFNLFYKKFKKTFSWLPEKIAYRYAKNYGTRAYLFLKGKNSIVDLGVDFSNGLYEKEIDYLIQNEWAKTSDDILWRRTKLGLFFSEEEKASLDQWLLTKDH